MLVTALDAEEIGDYKYVAMTHGKQGVKGWRWQSADHAGTRPIPRAGTMIIDQASVQAVLNQSLPADTVPAPADLSGFSQLTGRAVVYRLPDGSFVGPDRQTPVEPGEQDLIIRVT